MCGMESNTSPNLTVQQVTEALEKLPAHRTDLRWGLKTTLEMVRRGIPIKSNSPGWVQVQNAVFVAEIDRGEECSS
jgi:hypothetical protein